MKKFRHFLIWLIALSFLPIGLILTPSKAKAAPDPVVQFTASLASGSEKVADPKIEVSLSKEATVDISVEYATISGTDAVSGTNYTLTGDTLTFKVGGQLSQTLPLKILDDKKFGSDKTIKIELSNLQPDSDVELSGNTVFTYTITEDNTPVTTLTKSPPAAEGLNGWFTSKATITLTPDREAATYYQWDPQDPKNLDNPQKYEGPIVDNFEGDHTLYYYSDGGISPVFYPEEYQSETFKVDTEAPSQSTLSAQITDDGFVYLSWQADADATSFEIWQGTNVFKTSATSFIDNTVVRGQTYTYKMATIDQAGNYSLFAELIVEVPSLPVVLSESVTVQPAAVQPTTVTPAIGEGISIRRVKPIPTSETITPQTAGISQEKIEITPPTEEKKEETKSWSRLLVALSILVIAAGAAIAGFYGYEWWMKRREEPPADSTPKNKSRW